MIKSLPRLCLYSPRCMGTTKIKDDKIFTTSFGRHSLLTFLTENDRIFSWSQTRTWDNYLTPSPPQPVKLPGLKVFAYTPVNSIFDGPAANLLSILCILIDIP